MRGSGDARRSHDRLAVLWGPLVWVLLVVLSAQVWLWTGRLQRADASHGFGQRTQVAADFTQTYLTGLTEREQQDAQTLLAARTVDQARFELFGAGFGYSAMGLLDGHGHLMLNRPPAPALIGKDLTRTQEHIRAAVEDNRIALSDVYISPVLKEPIVAIAVPFRTPYGRRVFAGGFVFDASPLGAYLRQAVNLSGGRAYYVDGNGNIGAAATMLPRQVTPLSRVDPGLARALRRAPSGSFRMDGSLWRYSSSPIVGTDWRLVAEVPHRQLYASADHAQQRFGAVLLTAAMLGLGATVIITIGADRRRRTELRLRALNEQYTSQASDLKASNAELESFSYSVAHDLRAPLRAMTGYAEILLEDHTAQDPAGRMPPADAGRLLDKIRSNATKMAELIDALLSFSRMGRQRLSMVTVDLTALARSVWDSTAPRRTGRDIRFDLADLPPCRGDPELLRRVLDSLLDNAVKFTRDRPTAHIEVGGRPGPDGFVTYYVKDDGTGFDPEYADQLFEPFQRLHPPGSFEGTGIGLSLTQRIVMRHGGRIFAESSPGEGTTVSFVLPGA